MTPTDDLFQLIKSLTRTEKRYFKVFASQHVIGNENNYIKLFDAIEKQHEYNEGDIKKIFKDENFIKHLPPQKVYLYNLILKSLELYHSSIESDLRSAVNQVKILYDKGLYAQCEKRIARVKKSAERYEKFPILFDLLRWEGQLAYAHNYAGKSVEDVEKIYDKLSGYLNTYAVVISCVAFGAKVEIARKKMGTLRTEEEKEKYNILIKKSLELEEKKITSFEGKAYYYQAMFADSFFRKKLTKAPTFLEKALVMMEENPHRVEDYPRFYVITLQNLIVLKRNLKKYDEVLPLIKKMKELNFKDRSLKEEYISQADHMEIVFYIATGEFEEALKVVKRMEKEKFHLEVFRKNREHEINLYYNTALVYFGVNDYAACNKMLNKIILNESWDIRSDLHCFARIIALISNYERKRTDLIEYSFKSTYKFLLNRKGIYKLERILLEYIRTKLQKAESRKQQTDVFKSLKMELELLEKDPDEKRALSYFQFIPWLDSKIEGKPFADMVKRKVESERQ
jgi:hypothetical protein